jgi:hypothetical protein
MDMDMDTDTDTYTDVDMDRDMDRDTNKKINRFIASKLRVLMYSMIALSLRILKSKRKFVDSSLQI